MIFFYKQTNFFIILTLLLSFLNLATATPVSDMAQQNGINDKIIKATSAAPKQPLTIAINKTSFPYHATDKYGKVIGLMPDLWRLWAKKQQVEIEFVVLNWLETLKQVALGNVDIHAGLSIINSRRKTLAFSKPLFSIYSHFYVNQNLNSVNSLADLKPYTIGVVKGSAHIEALKINHPDFSLKTYNNRHELYRAALNNEILVFTGLENLADNFDDYETLRQQFPVHKLLRNQQSQYGAAVAKGKTELLAYINEGFEKISNKERAIIERKWLALDKQKDSLLVVFSANYPPYMGISPSGEPQGLLIDVWRLWSQHVGINVEFVARDLVEALDLVAEQKADVLLAFPNNIEIPETTSFAQPIYITNAQLYLSNKITNDDGKRVSTLTQFSQNFAQQVIGLWKNSPFKQPLLAQYPQLKLRYFNSVSHMLNTAERGEISGFVGLGDLVNAKLVENNLQTSFYQLDIAVTALKLTPVIHNSNKKLLHSINKGFSELNINSLINIEDNWLKGTTGEYYYKKKATKVALTAAQRDFIASHKKINLGIVKKLSPVEFINDEGKFSGINKEVIKLISDRTGLKFKVSAFDNWQELYSALLSKKIDLLGNIMATDKRAMQMLFTDSYWQMPWVIVHPQYNGRKTKLDYFYGKEMAIVKGHYLIAKLTKQHPLITFKLVANREQGLTALQQERVDGFITSIASATHLLKQENSVNFMISIMENVSVEKSHFGINTQLPLLQAIMNKGLATITDSEKQNIYDNWFTLEIKTGLDKEVVFKLAAKIGVVILIVLAVILLWNRRLQAEITHRETLEKRMKHMATHDELTGLANRVLLKDRLSTAIEFHRRQSLKMAVLFIDLDGFKNVNDSHGHDIGDELLQQVALRLLGCVRSSDTVVRFGGDEFVLLLTGLHNANKAAKVADKVLKLIQKEFELSSAKALIGCSIGIAMYPADGDNDIDLLKIADTLMYKVKAAGKNHYLFN